RYGFNGKEKDDDFAGGVTSAVYDYGFRIYDARIAKFLSVDPLTKKYPELTPYQFASNTPIMAIDLDGKEAEPRIWMGMVPQAKLKIYNEDRAKNAGINIVGGALGLTLAIDVFFTKGWLTRTMMAYTAGDMLDYMSKAERTNDPVLKQYYSQKAGEAATVVLTGSLLDVGLPLVFKGLSKAGVLKDANFAQNTINKGRVFSTEGQKIYTEMAGTPIKTVDDLVNALKNGSVSANQLKLDYVVIDGQKVILNTRTSVALSEAGIPKSKWVGVDQTGVEVPGMAGTTFDDLAKAQIKNNNLPATGTPETPK
ncbi:MAG TPA: RHS repeat-associated core domain-containing protein, partial [Bacteroidales bacterium]